MNREAVLSRIEQIAREQGGYLTSGQAKRLDVAANDLARLCRTRHLRRAARGVYALTGVFESPREHVIAAWLRLNGDRLPWDRAEPVAVASHLTAAELHEVGTFPPGVPSFTLTKRRYRPPAGSVRLYESRLAPTDWDWMYLPEGLRMPVTAPERTIVDIAFSGEDRDHVLDALAEFRHRGAISEGALKEALQRRKERRGRGSVAWLVDYLGHDGA